MDKRDEAKKARSMFYTSRSDLLSDVKAYEACLAARNRSNADLRMFAEDVSLNSSHLFKNSELTFFSIFFRTSSLSRPSEMYKIYVTIILPLLAMSDLYLLEHLLLQHL